MEIDVKERAQSVPNLKASSSSLSKSKTSLTGSLDRKRRKFSSHSNEDILTRVRLLDNTDFDVTINTKAKGQVLFDKVCENVNILEKEYFGLSFRDVDELRWWLNNDKHIDKQIKNGPWVFNFEVKFYPPEPSVLQEDITRYQLCLQVRNDIVAGKLPCSFVTQALLGSFFVQSEVGDYDPEEHKHGYLQLFQFGPEPSQELEFKVVELHKAQKGKSPSEADSLYLRNAKRLAMYGIDCHSAQDSDDVDIMLGVCSYGISIYRNKLRINHFAWPKILKISFLEKKFYLKIRPGQFEEYENTVGFKLSNARAAKRLWKVAVEHHTFFRLKTPQVPEKHLLTLPRFGSRFRYSGRTHHQIRARGLSTRTAPNFTRTMSQRWSSRSMDELSHFSLDLDRTINKSQDEKLMKILEEMVMGSEEEQCENRRGRDRRPILETSIDSDLVSDKKKQDQQSFGIPSLHDQNSQTYQISVSQPNRLDSASSWEPSVYDSGDALNMFASQEVSGGSYVTESDKFLRAHSVDVLGAGNSAPSGKYSYSEENFGRDIEMDKILGKLDVDRFMHSQVATEPNLAAQDKVDLLHSGLKSESALADKVLKTSEDILEDEVFQPPEDVTSPGSETQQDTKMNLSQPTFANMPSSLRETSKEKRFHFPFNFGKSFGDKKNKNKDQHSKHELNSVEEKDEKDKKKKKKLFKTKMVANDIEIKDENIISSTSLVSEDNIIKEENKIPSSEKGSVEIIEIVETEDRKLKEKKHSKHKFKVEHEDKESKSKNKKQKNLNPATEKEMKSEKNELKIIDIEKEKEEAKKDSVTESKEKHEDSKKSKKKIKDKKVNEKDILNDKKIKIDTELFEDNKNINESSKVSPEKIDIEKNNVNELKTNEHKVELEVVSEINLNITDVNEPIKELKQTSVKEKAAEIELKLEKIKSKKENEKYKEINKEIIKKKDKETTKTNEKEIDKVKTKDAKKNDKESKEKKGMFSFFKIKKKDMNSVKSEGKSKDKKKKNNTSIEEIQSEGLEVNNVQENNIEHNERLIDANHISRDTESKIDEVLNLELKSDFQVDKTNKMVTNDSFVSPLSSVVVEMGNNMEVHRLPSESIDEANLPTISLYTEAEAEMKGIHGKSDIHTSLLADDYEVNNELNTIEGNDAVSSDIELDFHFPGNSLGLLLKKAEDFHYSSNNLENSYDIKPLETNVKDIISDGYESSFGDSISSQKSNQYSSNVNQNRSKSNEDVKDKSITNRIYNETDIDFPEERSSIEENSSKQENVVSLKNDQIKLLENKNNQTSHLFESKIDQNKLPLETDLDDIECLGTSNSPLEIEILSSTSPLISKNIDISTKIIQKSSLSENSKTKADISDQKFSLTLNEINESQNKFQQSSQLPKLHIEAMKYDTANAEPGIVLLADKNVIHKTYTSYHETDLDTLTKPQNTIDISNQSLINAKIPVRNFTEPPQSKEKSISDKYIHSPLDLQSGKRYPLQESNINYSISNVLSEKKQPLQETNIDYITSNVLSEEKKTLSKTNIDDIPSTIILEKKQFFQEIDIIPSTALPEKKQLFQDMNIDDVTSDAVSEKYPESNLKTNVNHPSPRLKRLIDKASDQNLNKNQDASDNLLIRSQKKSNSSQVYNIINPNNIAVVETSKENKPHLDTHTFSDKFNLNQNLIHKDATVDTSNKLFQDNNVELLDDNFNKTSLKDIDLIQMKINAGNKHSSSSLGNNDQDWRYLNILSEDNDHRVAPVGSEISKNKHVHISDAKPLEIKPHSPGISPSPTRKDIQDARAKFFSQQPVPSSYSSSLLDKVRTFTTMPPVTNPTSPLISSQLTSPSFTTFGKTSSSETSGDKKPSSFPYHSSDSVPELKTYAEYLASKYPQRSFAYPRHTFEATKSHQESDPSKYKWKSEQNQPPSTSLKVSPEQVVPQFVKADVIECIPEKTIMVVDVEPDLRYSPVIKKNILQETVISKVEPENVKYNSPEKIEIDDDSSIGEEKSCEDDDSLDEYESAENDKSGEIDQSFEADNNLSENIQKRQYTVEIDPSTGAKVVTIKTTIFKPVLLVGDDDDDKQFQSDDQISNGHTPSEDYNDVNKSFSSIDIDALKKDDNVSQVGRFSPSIIQGIVSGAPCAKTAAVETVRLRSGSEMTETDLDETKDVKFSQPRENILNNKASTLDLENKEHIPSSYHKIVHEIITLPENIESNKIYNISKGKYIPSEQLIEKLPLLPSEKEFVNSDTKDPFHNTFKESESGNRTESTEKPLLQSILDSLKGDGKLNVLDSVILKEETEEERSSHDTKESTAEGKEYHQEKKEQVKTTKKVTYEKTIIEFTSSKDMKPLLFSGELSAFTPVNQRLDESFSSYERKVEDDEDSKKHEYIHKVSSEIHTSENVIPIINGKLPAHEVQETDLDMHFNNKLKEMNDVRKTNTFTETLYSEKSGMDSDAESVKSDHLKAKYMYQPFPGCKILKFSKETDIDKVCRPLVINLPDQTKIPKKEEYYEEPDIKYNLVQEYMPEKYKTQKAEVNDKKDSPIYATVIKSSERDKGTENKELNETFQSEISETLSVQSLPVKGKKGFFSFGSSWKKGKKEDKNKSLDFYNDDTISFSPSIAESTTSELNLSKDSNMQNKKEIKQKNKDKKSKIPKKNKDASPLLFAEQSINAEESNEKSKKDKNAKDKKDEKLSKEEKRKQQIEARIMKIHEEEERKRRRRERKKLELEKSRSQINLDDSEMSTKSVGVIPQLSKAESKPKSIDRSASPATQAVYFSALNRKIESDEYIQAKEYSSPTSSSKYPFHHITKPEDESKRVKRIYAPIPTPFGYGYKYSYKQVGLKDSGETVDDKISLVSGKGYQFSDDLEIMHISSNAQKISLPKEFLLPSEFDLDGGPIIDESKIIGRSTPISEITNPGAFQTSSVYSSSMTLQSRTSSVASIETYGSDKSGSRIPVYHAKIKTSEQAFEQAKQDFIKPAEVKSNHHRESKLPRLSSGSEFDRALSAAISDSTQLNQDLKVDKIQFNKNDKTKNM